MSEAPITAIHSQLLPSALAGAIREAYGFDGPLHLTLLRAWTNDVYAVTSTDAFFVLKLYRWVWRGPLDVSWEVALQDWLQQRDAPVAAVIPLANGDRFGTLRAPEGQRCFALFQGASGAKPRAPWSPELYEQYGRGAAAMHDAAEGFRESGSPLRRTLDTLLDESLARISPWLSERPDDLGTLGRVVKTVRAHLTPLLPDLDWGICHGDLSLDNLHVRYDGRIMFYDFDSACYGWRAWDVCNALGYATPEHQEAFLLHALGCLAEPDHALRSSAGS